MLLSFTHENHLSPRLPGSLGLGSHCSLQLLGHPNILHLVMTLVICDYDDEGDNDDNDVVMCDDNGDGKSSWRQFHPNPYLHSLNLDPPRFGALVEDSLHLKRNRLPVGEDITQSFRPQHIPGKMCKICCAVQNKVQNWF